MSLERELEKRDRLLAEKSARIRELEAQLAERTCRFVDDSDGEFPPKCSSCGYEPSAYECSWFSDDGYVYEGNYCPNCGARVIGVGE